MKIMPWILGACAAAAAGAIGGASITTTPIINRGDTLAGIPDHAAPVPKIDRNAPALPNHYPLETPSGTIQVAELSSHGLYRNRRFERSYHRVDLAFAPATKLGTTEDRVVPAKPILAAAPPATPRQHAVPTRQAAAQPAPIALQAKPLAHPAAERPVQIRSEVAGSASTKGGSRTIDVSVVLAGRN